MCLELAMGMLMRRGLGLFAVHGQHQPKQLCHDQAETKPSLLWYPQPAEHEKTGSIPHIP